MLAIGSLTVGSDASLVVIDCNLAGPFTSAVDYYLQFANSYKRRAERTTD
jgi:hypothetical protein